MKTITVIISDELHNLLMDLAEKEYRPFDMQVKKILGEYFAKKQPHFRGVDVKVRDAVAELYTDNETY